MGELVQTLDRYFEFLILGGLALALFGFIFQRSVIIDWHRAFLRITPEHVSAAAGEDRDNPRLASESISTTLYVALEWVIPIAACYVVGFVLNTMAYAVLQRTHVDVICSVSKYLADDKATKFEMEPNWRFFLLPIRMTNQPPQECADAYRTDNRRQVNWQISHRESYDSAVDALIKQMRLLRGFIILSVFFTVISSLRLFYHLVEKLRGQGPSIRVSVRRWLLVSTVLLFSYFTSMLMYWNIEANFHEEVFASESQTGGQGPPASPGLDPHGTMITPKNP